MNRFFIFYIIANENKIRVRLRCLCALCDAFLLCCMTKAANKSILQRHQFFNWISIECCRIKKWLHGTVYVVVVGALGLPHKWPVYDTIILLGIRTDCADRHTMCKCCNKCESETVFRLILVHTARLPSGLPYALRTVVSPECCAFDVIDLWELQEPFRSKRRMAHLFHWNGGYLVCVCVLLFQYNYCLFFRRVSFVSCFSHRDFSN